MAKVKWEVSPAPTGRYKSFMRRLWPSGRTECNMFFMIKSASDYVPRLAKSGDHSELSLRVRDDASKSSKIYTLKKRFATLKELKEFVAKLDIDNLRAVMREWHQKQED